MITQYNQQQSILPGQVTVFRGVLYKAVKKQPNAPCVAQCDCRMPDFTDAYGCSGFCYRWANGDDLVFRSVREADLTINDCVLVETKFMASCRTWRIRIEAML